MPQAFEDDSLQQAVEHHLRHRLALGAAAPTTAGDALMELFSQPKTVLPTVSEEKT